ncbi:hypothetical protein D9619_000319 [Psilocybe cf. subviscida]|uniref:TLC domain-containing protein n=1 Tax=Psilocybe cf. subviscida TaxID=2480587 RepID=A0A8H5F3R9_9AGAR|nr:hypothetical protein D9619_000319 [Psilocybe cf. subviscida]
MYRNVFAKDDEESEHGDAHEFFFGGAGAGASSSSSISISSSESSDAFSRFDWRPPSASLSRGRFPFVRRELACTAVGATNSGSSARRVARCAITARGVFSGESRHGSAHVAHQRLVVEEHALARAHRRGRTCEVGDDVDDAPIGGEEGEELRLQLLFIDLIIEVVDVEGGVGLIGGGGHGGEVMDDGRDGDGASGRKEKYSHEPPSFSPFPSAMAALRDYLVPFYTLQYPVATPAHPDSFSDSAYYTVGPLDACIVIATIAVMAVLRDVLRLYAFEPFARWKLHRDLAARLNTRMKGVANGKANGNGYAANGNGAAPNGNGHAANGNGHSNGHANGVAKASQPTAKDLKQLNRKVMRFAEQGWSVVYYIAQFAFGVYVHYNLPTRLLDPVDLWVGYPHIPLAGTVKFYYLTQTAFYLHQVLIINAEQRRSDHVQMMLHHVITVGLMASSYAVHLTRIGCAIMMLMDHNDIFLPLAKMFRYLDLSQTLTDATFGYFMFSWFVARHVLFNILIYSTIFTGPKIMGSTLRWDPANGLYVSANGFKVFWVALIMLQIMWFVIICRVAYRVMGGSGAADERSDDEDDESNAKKNN